ncbi:conjugal transfer protein TraG N-terminal domain-containing protein [Achromobacter xylosoxidans]|uniref:conjugal transfer protein TraG N-terminal domain-containing protein n=1 Tax=Alcaligenes xylosoxydans xylosoxydans TaxID=85698 RepID=UPI001F148827|nr:conjugal transfer protein TraG N-terminal domain-containing protein [Achromobacter xylosoxidans]
MATFTTYLTGPLDMFYATLNGVAMAFNDTGLITGAAVLGGLLAIASGAWFHMNQYMPSTVNRGHSIFESAVIIVLALTAAGLPIRNQLVNVYDGSIRAVDNVPAVLGIPAALYSQLSYGVLETVDTSFSTVSGSYMTVAQNGFVTPLALLFTMRGGLEKADPAMVATWKNFVLYCSPNSAVNSTETEQVPDYFNYLLDNSKRGGVLIGYINYDGTGNIEAGVAMSCIEAAEALRSRVDLLFANANLSTSPLNTLINQNMKTAKVGLGAGGQSSYTVADVENSYNALMQLGAGWGQSAQQFMLNALLRNATADTYRCRLAATSPSAFNECTMMQSDAMEKYKVDATAAGSGFQKTMFTGMTYMQMLYYAFGVIVFLYGLIAGARCFGAMAKFMQFGAWVFSWLPFAAVINGFIQLTVVEKMGQYALNALTLQNFDAVMYDTLSTNLAYASDLMAAVPLLTMAIIYGSPYAMAGMAQRMSGRDYVSEDKVAPDSVKNSAPIQVTPAYTQNMHAGGASSYAADRQIQVGNDLSAMQQSTWQQTQQAQASVADAMAQVHSTAFGLKSGSSTSTAVRDTVATGEESAQMAAQQTFKQRLIESGMTEQKADAIFREQSKSIGTSVDGKLGFSAPMVGGVSAGRSVSWTDSDGKRHTETITQQESEKINRAAMAANSSATTIRMGALSDAAHQVQRSDGWESSDVRSATGSVTETVSRARSEMETYARTESAGSRIGAGFTLSLSQNGHLLERNDSYAPVKSTIDDLHNKLVEARPELQSVTNTTYRQLTDQAGSNRAGSEEWAKLETLRQYDQGGYVRAVDVIAGATGIGTGFDAGALRGVSGDVQALAPPDVTGRVGPGGDASYRSAGVPDTMTGDQLRQQLQSSNQGSTIVRRGETLEEANHARYEGQNAAPGSRAADVDLTGRVIETLSGVPASDPVARAQAYLSGRAFADAPPVDGQLRGDATPIAGDRQNGPSSASPVQMPVAAPVADGQLRGDAAPIAGDRQNGPSSASPVQMPVAVPVADVQLRGDAAPVAGDRQNGQSSASPVQTPAAVPVADGQLRGDAAPIAGDRQNGPSSASPVQTPVAAPVFDGQLRGDAAPIAGDRPTAPASATPIQTTAMGPSSASEGGGSQVPMARNLTAGTEIGGGLGAGAAAAAPRSFERSEVVWSSDPQDAEGSSPSRQDAPGGRLFDGQQGRNVRPKRD